MRIRMKSPAVGVEDAEAFVRLSRSVDAMCIMSDNKEIGFKSPRAPAIKGTLRFLRDRQAVARKFSLCPTTDGGMRISFLSDAADAVMHNLIINSMGTPIIQSPDDDTAYRGLGDKAFRKRISKLVQPSPTKYGINNFIEDGITFHSEQEAKRYRHLRQEEKLGNIEGLKAQVPYPFEESGKHCFTYYADFTYIEHGALVIEDVKGPVLPVYSLKKKLIEARYGIEIIEWPTPRKVLQRRAAKAARDEAERVKRQAIDMRKAAALAKRMSKAAEKEERALKRGMTTPKDSVTREKLEDKK